MEQSFRRAVADARSHGGLPFAALLSEDRIADAFGSASAIRRGWLFTRATIVWTFLSQCLSADHSCRDAVQRLVAWLAAANQRSGSANTGAYCTARDQLPEEVSRELVRDTGRQPDQHSPADWLWHGRRVRVADGTTLTMADTEANQQAYPQMRSQKPGCGQPILRMLVVFSLAVGTVLESAVSPYTGKRTGENALLRTLHGVFRPGDVLLADRYFSGWCDIAIWMSLGVDVVIRKHQLRATDFRTGHRLGRHDHLVVWSRPARPEWMSREDYAALPRSLTLREIRVVVDRPGFRTRVIVVVTSLLDSNDIPATALAQLYRRRWEAELHLRSIKTVMQMDHLRCKTPHRVRNEIAMHLTAYNLIRGAMAAAAVATGREPWEVSFKGTLQAVNNLLPLLAEMTAEDWCDLLFQLITTDTVGHRPDRVEPRVKKRRPKTYPLMNQPRGDYATQ